MNRLVLNAPYSLLYGRMPTITEVWADLGRLDLQSTVRALSRLLYVVFYCREHDSGMLRGAEQHWLGAETLEKLGSYRRGDKPPVRVFYRQQILIAMKLLCLSHAQADGLGADDEDARHGIGDALLKVTDLLPSRPEDHVSRDLISDPSSVLHTFNLSVMIENEAPAAWTLARYDRILSRCVSQAPAEMEGRNLEWSEHFQRRHGVQFHDVALLSRVLFLWFWSRRNDAGYSGDHSWLDRRSFFANCVIEPVRIDAALRHLSVSWDDLPSYAWRHARGPVPTDITLFLDKPLIRDPPGYQIVDLTALLGMSGDRLLRQIRDAMPVEERQDGFGGVLGRAFEDHVAWLLQQVYPEPRQLVGRLVRQPRKGKAELDFAISYGSVHILIEAKGALTPDHAVYGGDAFGFGTELYNRYARDKGTGQLSNYVTSLRAGAQADAPARVIPVLITLDPTLSGYSVTSTLRRRLGEKLGARRAANDRAGRPFVSPLVVLTIEDLECALARVERGESLVDILDHVIAHDEGGIQPARELIRSGSGGTPSAPKCLAEALDATIGRDAEELFGPQGTATAREESC